MSKIKIFSLGGLNEIGKNMYVVEVDQDIFVFDAGLKYADDNNLGVDYIIPNYDYLKENKERIKGLFITHGHDQQMGAISDILLDIPNLKVYGTTFTLEILKEELQEDGIQTEHLIEIKPHKKLNFGNNSVFPISLTHGVPDAVGYVLYTPDGAIFYTGNFVFDPTMSDFYKTDVGKLAYVGKQGVLCLLSESMYADKKGFTSPNHRTSALIREILYKHNNERILFNVFQAQLNRIQELFNEVIKTNRRVVIMGKRLEALILRSIDMKYIDFDKTRIGSLKEVEDKNVVVLISDEREKPFSNIKRIIRGYDKFIKIDEHDTVVFASPVYDGMEKSFTKVLDDIAALGANLVTFSNKKYLSLHASSEDLMLMIDLMKPTYYFPVNGEYRNQVANKDVALQVGMKEENIILNLNGQVATFINGKLLDTKETIKTDEVLIDGKTPGDIGELVLKDREMLSDNGIVIVTATLDRMTKKVLAGPEILTRGFIYVKENIDLIKEAERISNEIIENNIKPHYVDFNKIKMEVRDKVGKYFYDETECKPMILIVIQEV
ncbi:MAG: ribonuclease J [Firmicutes bacterium]|nr:ribonuclease J [Bacillota bacterium]